MINHSELTKTIIAELDALKLRLIGLTAGGVVEEGGTLVAVPAMGTTTRQVYNFGASSKLRLAGVIPKLGAVCEKAIGISTQDFTVICGLRAIDEQVAAVKAGNSQTMHSMHLKQPDGWSHAVDLVPWVDGKAVWDWKRIYPIAYAMDQAATALGYAGNIRWGGAWDRRLSDFGNNADSYYAEALAYSKRHPGKDFLDGPHFEWIA